MNIVFRPSFTPLSIAASHRHAKIVRLLLARGARQRVRNYKGEDPLRKAVRGGWDGVAQILLEHGADINGQQQPSLVIAKSCGYTYDKIPTGEGCDIAYRSFTQSEYMAPTSKASSSSLYPRLTLHQVDIHLLLGQFSRKPRKRTCR